MYFNNEQSKNDTNIDSEFKKSNKKEGFNYQDLLNNKYIRYGLIGLVALVILIVIISLFSNKTNYFIELYGGNEIKIYKNTEYNEIGYRVYDNKGNNYYDYVEIIGNVNTNEAGDYVLTYRYKNKSVIRKVTVENSSIDTYIIVKGNKEESVNVNSIYNEQGATVFDSSNAILQNNMLVFSNLDITKVGKYEIVYSVKNDKGYTVSAKRIVNVK